MNIDPFKKTQEYIGTLNGQCKYELMALHNDYSINQPEQLLIKGFSFQAST